MEGRRRRFSLYKLHNGRCGEEQESRSHGMMEEFNRNKRTGRGREEWGKPGWPWSDALSQAHFRLADTAVGGRVRRRFHQRTVVFVIT